MKIKKVILLEVTAADLVNGVFYNEDVIEVADKCFYEMKGLVKVDLPNCKKIGNWCFCYNAALTTLSLPQLTTCGYYCFRYHAALTTLSMPQLTTCGDDCFRDNAALTTLSLPNLNLRVKNVDGYCYVVEAEKTTKGVVIYTGYNLNGITKSVIDKQVCFVADNDGFTAHGNTVKQAISDVQFKTIAEKLKNDPIHPDTEITVMYYRTVTGACELGCKDWMAHNNVNVDSIKAKDLLPLLRKSNAYGLNKIESLLTF